jgi:hypothetical protein
MKWAAALALIVIAGHAVSAQVSGTASAMVDVLPDPDETAGRQTITELRLRVFAEGKHDVNELFRLNASAYVDGLVGQRGLAGTVTDAVVRPVDLYAEWAKPRFDLRVGASRVVWGRLDEFQPTDVVNPIDVSRFLLEGRSEARLSVGLVRSRVFLGPSTLEAVLVPAFRAGTFDQLDEETSPFGVVSGFSRTPESGSGSVMSGFSRTIERDEPDLAFRNTQGGVRFTSTASRVDWGIVAYRGFRAFPIVTASVTQSGISLSETFPRFTMIGGDFETVRGPWGLRGEVAAFVDDQLQATGLQAGAEPRGVPGKSVDAGIGIDRRAAEYRVAANVLWAWRSADDVDLPALEDESLRGSDLTLVMAVDRSFARETRTLRVFGVYDPVDATAFGRVIAAVSLRDNVWLEGSGGVFTGTSTDVIGRLSRRDFLYARLKVFF